MLKAMFPACASFGPLFMVMGFLMPNRGEGLPISFFLAVPGALMTTIALNMLYRAVTSLERPAGMTTTTAETKLPGSVST
ncbi:hypothetical protein [Planctellipticum variicoloris]|uniref:hypothetical protein n=1 Tax=Planctellipticum variicoloris TaxID=3064265 RepID=UPI003013B0B7|nr:hypothetical protein SH412_002509 [Planctomycetaceae bacterium SH412]